MSLCKNSGERQFPHDLILFQVAKSMGPNPRLNVIIFTTSSIFQSEISSSAICTICIWTWLLVHAEWILFMILFSYSCFLPTENMPVHKNDSSKNHGLFVNWELISKWRYARHLFTAKWNVMAMFGFHCGFFFFHPENVRLSYFYFSLTGWIQEY